MKTFIIEYQNLEARIDPSPYHPVRQDRIVKLQNSGLQLKPLKDVVEFRREIVKEKSDDAPYLGLENIVSDTGEYVQDGEEKEEFGSAFRFYKGDILFPKLRPYLNKVHLAMFDGYCSTEIHVLQAKEVDNYYLWAFLISDIVVNQTSFLMTGNTLPRLQTDDVNNLLIPIPKESEQKTVRDIMQSAYQKKQELEQEAEELFEGIQNMIFTSLGIEKREREDSLTKVISSVEVQNNRFDPFYYVHPQDTKPSNMYEEKTLGEIAELEKGKSISKKNINSGEYPVIAGGQSSPYSIDRYNYEGNVITVSASGAYSGYVWYHDYPIFASDCTVIKSKNEEEVSTHYIYCVLRAKQRFIYNMQQGAGQPHVYASDLEILNIPIPSKEKQKEISNEVQKRIKENKTLRKTAKEVIEQAKAQVEEIILGK